MRETRRSVVALFVVLALSFSIGPGVVAGGHPGSSTAAESIDVSGVHPAIDTGDVVHQQPGAAESCFPGNGSEFTIGSQGPQIDMIVHMSLLTNLGAPGTMGIEMAGTTGREYIVVLRTGILFDGVHDAGSFLSDPFSQFSVAFEFDLSLPMISGATGEDVSYSGDDAPIDAPIGDAACTA
ncbi:MAG: DUF7332 family protein [Halobacteriota archaeon]